MALILRVIFLSILSFPLHNYGNQRVSGAEWPFMCECGIKKQLTQSVTLLTCDSQPGPATVNSLAAICCDLLLHVISCVIFFCHTTNYILIAY